MTTESLVTRAYVLTENGVAHTLEYYLCSEPDQSGATLYGITVKQCTDGLVLSESELISCSRDDVCRIIHMFAKNFVFPYTLHNLIDDYTLLKS